MYAPLCEVWMNSYQKHTRDNSSNFQFAFSQNVSKLSYEVLAVNPRYVLFYICVGTDCVDLIWERVYLYIYMRPYMVDKMLKSN